MPWATRPSPPPLRRPCWRTPRRDTSRREGTNTIATDHLRFWRYHIWKNSTWMWMSWKKWDMWKTYSCHNMYLVVLSYIFGKRWWLSCNCTRSDTRRDVASLSIIPYRLTALQARKPDECGNSAWNGRGIETMQNFLSSVRHCIAYCLRYIGRAAPNNPYMQPTASWLASFTKMGESWRIITNPGRGLSWK